MGYKCFTSEDNSLNYGGVCLASDAQFSDFLGSMGPAQFVGRQTLATTPMGECPKTCSKGGGGPHQKPRVSPLPGLHPLSTRPGAQVAPARRSAEPGRSAWGLVLLSGPVAGDVEIGLQERNGQLEVDIIQARGLTAKPGSKTLPGVIVWGNYGRMERKQFMGVARVLLEELDLTTLAVGWYKLFPTSSMVDPATGPLLRQASQLSLESTVGPCGERS
ncbi:hypothetical protein Celaphus_00008003 [Cervus elaphus hippelaphus]|uniref:Uncharacterized protein n=1 Tax=Cervus elaphus hippelaphus TaxID=46360 RepID=A0A212CB78_CEREH|nr:hypothetical protein Celaphus_00008003 [Cervus elaphus hippelaphus]